MLRNRRNFSGRHRIYDDDIYKDFGEQPAVIELQVGYKLIPFVSEDSKLAKKLKYLRNEIDSEYGLPLPPIHIRDNMCLDPNEYGFLLHGFEIAGYEGARRDYCLCIDTGSVTKELIGIKTREPAFGMEAILLPEEERLEAKALGYVVPDWESVIRSHLTEVIKKNITKFLDQTMVNTLINKVRDKNPDVVDDVFFLHNFTTAKMKTILNWLLEEGICIRDMNTILEAIADNLEETQSLVELREKVREKLAYQFLPKVADRKKEFHVIRISQSLSETFFDHIYVPQPKNELPYFALAPDERNKLNVEITKVANRIKEKGYEPVFLIISSLRSALSVYIKQYFGNWACISDKELASVYKDYKVVIEEELEVDEIKVNESCSGSN